MGISGYKEKIHVCNIVLHFCMSPDVMFRTDNCHRCLLRGSKRPVFATLLVTEDPTLPVPLWLDLCGTRLT